jgi:hypothetical protein
MDDILAEEAEHTDDFLDLLGQLTGPAPHGKGRSVCSRAAHPAVAVCGWRMNCPGGRLAGLAEAPSGGPEQPVSHLTSRSPFLPSRVRRHRPVQMRSVSRGSARRPCIFAP